LLQEALEVLKHDFEVWIIGATRDDATRASKPVASPARGSLHGKTLLDAVDKDTETLLLVLLKFGVGNKCRLRFFEERAFLGELSEFGGSYCLKCF
jgi:hypothetical protein